MYYYSIQYTTIIYPAGTCDLYHLADFARFRNIGNLNIEYVIQ